MNYFLWTWFTEGDYSYDVLKIKEKLKNYGMFVILSDAWATTGGGVKPSIVTLTVSELLHASSTILLLT